jgi:hypothetical protein
LVGEEPHIKCNCSSPMQVVFVWYAGSDYTQFRKPTHLGQDLRDNARGLPCRFAVHLHYLVLRTAGTPSWRYPRPKISFHSNPFLWLHCGLRLVHSYSVIDARSSLSVHSFFSFRIYVLTKRLYVPSLIWFMASLLLVGRIVICATSLRAASLQSYLMQWGWLLTTNWCISVACDFVITTTLVVVLHRRRSQALKK